MSLNEQLLADMKTAMKEKQAETLSVLRMVRSALKNKQIDVQRDLTDEDIHAVIKTMVKQTKDALESFEEGGREEMAAQSRAEIVVLERYLPAQLDDVALEAVVKGAIEESGATSKADMGRAMGAAMKAVAGQADGGRVKALVAKLLPVVVLCVLAAHPAEAQAIAPVGTEVSTLETVLRVFRALIVVAGILCVNMILKGAFTYMVSSGRNETQKDAWSDMSSGILGTVFVVLLFIVLTIVINK